MAGDPSVGFPAPLGVPPRYQGQTEPPRESAAPPAPQKSRIWLHFLLFGLTAVSMQFTAMELNGDVPAGHSPFGFAAYQAVSLLAILMVHELGHYVAARLHHVPASIPYFVPFPRFSLFGTMGAVISMSDAGTSPAFSVGDAGTDDSCSASSKPGRVCRPAARDAGGGHGAAFA